MGWPGTLFPLFCSSYGAKDLTCGFAGVFEGVFLKYCEVWAGAVPGWELGRGGAGLGSVAAVFAMARCMSDGAQQMEGDAVPSGGTVWDCRSGTPWWVGSEMTACKGLIRVGE